MNGGVMTKFILGARMRGYNRTFFKDYGGALLALICTAVVLKITDATFEHVGHPLTFRFAYVLPVIWTAVRHGFGPALLVVAGTTCMGDESLLETQWPWHLSVWELIRPLTFAGTAAVVAWYVNAYREVRLNLERQVGERTAQISAANTALTSVLRQRRVVEEETRKAATFLQQIMNSITDPIFMKDRQSRFVLVNDAMCELMGLPREELIGHEGLQLVTPEQRATFLEKDAMVFQTQQENTNEEPINSRQGKVRTILTKKMPFTDDLGGQFLIGIIRDITDWKHAQELLRSRAAALDAAADAIVISDRTGMIEYVNPAFTRSTGYRSEEAVGQRTSLLKSGKHDEQFYRCLWQTILAGRPWTGELINLRKDGTLYEEESSITPVLDDHGEIVRFVAIKRDVVARNRAERIEKERNHLRDAVRGMEQVLGVVGHELRTPLAALRAMAELLLNDKVRETAQATEFIKAMHDESIRMASIVGDLLDAARLHSGTSQWNWSRFRVEESCRAALDSLRHLASAGSVALELHSQTPGLEMQGDAEAIRRLVLNLLTNASKHTEAGRIDIHVKGQMEGHQTWVEIQIADTGSGITPEVATRLGEAFALNAGIVGANYTRGAGLGLAICRGIVAAHGGTVTVQSALGVGTRVTVRVRSDLSGPVAGMVKAIEYNVAGAEARR